MEQTQADEERLQHLASERVKLVVGLYRDAKLLESNAPNLAAQGDMAGAQKDRVQAQHFYGIVSSECEQMEKNPSLYPTIPQECRDVREKFIGKGVASDKEK